MTVLYSDSDLPKLITFTTSLLINHVTVPVVF